MAFSEEEYGKDLYLKNDTITSSPRKDLDIVKYRKNLVQAVVNRLRTRKGELPAHPEYGSELYKLVGEPMNETTKSLIELYTIEALRQDPRIWEINSIEIQEDRFNKKVIINITVTPVNTTEPLNIVYPYFY
jgi:phage baseplate assembly protein W